MNVLVTGGAGYIGSHAVRKLVSQGHQVVVLDNLTNGHREAVKAPAKLIEGSTGDDILLQELFKTFQIEAVMHFAAYIEVGESVGNPGKYYENNFSNSLKLLDAMRIGEVKKIVFSSTAAVYGNPERIPIEETDQCQPINPYGRSKMMTEMAIEDFSKAHGLGYALLRYFNVAGASPDGMIGEDHHPESHLIPRILQVAREGNGAFVKIFGTDYATPDGTCVRDYIHIEDLVRAHVLALENMKVGEGHIFNLGSEKGFSVKQVIEACEKVTGQKLLIKEEERRPGDPAVLIASSRKIREYLGWKREYPMLETIIEHAWRWHLKHPNGYQAATHSQQSSVHLF